MVIALSMIFIDSDRRAVVLVTLTAPNVSHVTVDSFLLQLR